MGAGRVLLERAGRVLLERAGRLGGAGLGDCLDGLEDGLEKELESSGLGAGSWELGARSWEVIGECTVH